MTKIILFGDNDTTGDAVKILDAIKKETGVDQYVFLGDGPYASTGTKWVEMMKPFFPDVSKLVCVQGNHDDEESESEKTQQDIEAWIPSLKETPESGTDASWDKTSWLTSKQIKDVYLISMNSQDMDIEFKGRNQYNWVVKQLGKAVTLRKSGQVNWIINCVHKPWFTLKSSHSPYTAVREIYSDLFKDVVDCNFHGHNHNDQAWFPMVATKTEGNAAGQPLYTLAADGKTLDYTKPRGWTTNVQGHSGHEHNPFKENATANKNVMWANDKTFSYCVLETNPQTKIATVTWKDTAGKVLFHYAMTKAGSATTTTTTPPPPKPPTPKPQEPTPTPTTDPSAPTSPPPGPGYRWDSKQKRWVPKLEDPSFVPPHEDPEPLKPVPPVIVIPPPPPAPAGTAILDEHGTKMIYKITGKKQKMEIGTDHRNGQRFNNNHSFKNYMMIGYFKTGAGQEKLEMKTDGPNHGGCTQIPECMWYEPSIVVDTGEPELGGEWPHPKNHNNLPADFKEKLKKPITKTWVGYAVIAYTNKAGNRVVEQWDAIDPFDASGTKPTNNWHLNLRGIEKGQIFPKEHIPRDLDKVIAHEAGFESEIRMHGATSGDTEMKFCYVYEIVPPN